MQFSVIVEGGMDGQEPSSGGWEELELYLRSAKIPPALVRQLRSGQPRILKQQLSYEQAVTISDRLADLGLDSAIDPPIKPEANEAPELVGSPAGATPSSVQRASNGKSRRSVQKPKGMKSSEGSNTSIPSSTAKASRGGATRAAAEKPSDTPPKKPTSPSLGKAAKDVRALFRLPPGGKVEIALPRASRLRVWFLASYSILLPSLIAAGFLGFALVTAILSIALHGLLTSVSPLAGGIFLIAASAVGIVVLGLLTLPFWPRGNKQNPNPLLIKAKQDPRLVMMVTAICKLIGAPSPARIHLVPDAQLSSSLSCTGKSFFAMRSPLQGEVSLSLGSPLLASLSIRELAALIARECGRFAEPSLRRPYVILTGMSAWLQACLRRRSLTQQLRHSSERVASETLRGFIHNVLHRADQVQGFSFRAIGFCAQQTAGLLIDRDAVADRYQNAVLGKECRALQESLNTIENAYQQAVHSMVRDNPKQRFVESLATLTGELYKECQPASKQNDSAAGLVTSGQTASTLLNGFVDRDQQLTREFYQSRGLDSSRLRLMSVQELKRRESNEAKLRGIAQDYYGNWLHSGQHWQLPSENFAEAVEQKILLSRLNHCISRVRYMSPDRAQLIANYQTLKTHLTELRAAKKVLASGTAFRFRYCADAADDLDKQIAVRAAKLTQYSEELRQQNAVMGERIALGLALDRQHKTTILQIQRALKAISSVSGKLSELSTYQEELSTLQSYTPSKLVQHYQLHIKELNQSIDSTYRFIARKLQQCPYEFYDRRHANLQVLLDNRIQHALSQAPAIHKAKILEDTVNQAYINISELAASYAARMEKACGVESIRRVQAT